MKSTVKVKYKCYENIYWGYLMSGSGKASMNRRNVCREVRQRRPNGRAVMDGPGEVLKRDF